MITIGKGWKIFYRLSVNIRKNHHRGGTVELEYEDRIVVFLDVLGFSNFTNYTGATQVNQSKKIETINNYLEMLHKFFSPKNAIAKSRMVTSFSDSIVLSIKVEDIDDFDVELLEIYYLLINSIMKGFLIRGAIVYGKLIHTKNIIFGPALVEAYNRESKIAKYPRVIVDDAIVKDLNDLPNDKPREHRNLIQYDTDGMQYIDLFHDISVRLDNFRQHAQFLLAYTGILLENLNNPKLVEKTTWLKEKLSHYFDYYGEILNFLLDSDMTELDIEAFRGFVYQFDTEEYERKAP